MHKLLVVVISITIISCSNSRQISSAGQKYGEDTLITQSLFNDKASSISEENIAKILDGNYRLPDKIRVVIIKLENTTSRGYYNRYYDDEQLVKMQASYLDKISEELKKSARVSRVQLMPGLMVSKTPSFVALREAAVRMQADVVMVCSITSDIYSRYKIFSQPELKAFASTQVLLMDVRTGLIPASLISTKDFMTKKTKEQTNAGETSNYAQGEAVALTIAEIGSRLNSFLAENKY